MIFLKHESLSSAWTFNFVNSFDGGYARFKNGIPFGNNHLSKGLVTNEEFTGCLKKYISFVALFKFMII